MLNNSTWYNILYTQNIYLQKQIHNERIAKKKKMFLKYIGNPNNQQYTNSLDDYQFYIYVLLIHAHIHLPAAFPFIYILPPSQVILIYICGVIIKKKEKYFCIYAELTLKFILSVFIFINYHVLCYIWWWWW